jgi:hypothetical protein
MSHLLLHPTGALLLTDGSFLLLHDAQGANATSTITVDLRVTGTITISDGE